MVACHSEAIALDKLDRRETLATARSPLRERNQDLKRTLLAILAEQAVG